MTTEREIELLRGLDTVTTERIVALLADGPKSLADLLVAGFSRAQAEKGLAYLRYRGAIVSEPAGDPKRVVWTVYRLQR